MHENVCAVSYLKEVPATTLCISYTLMSLLSNSPSNFKFYHDFAQVMVHALDLTGERWRISLFLACWAHVSYYLCI